MIVRAAAALLVALSALAAALQPVDRATLTLWSWLAHGPFSRLTTFGPEAIGAQGKPSGASGWLATLLTGSLFGIQPLLPSLLNAACAAAAVTFLYVRCARWNGPAALVVTALAALTTAGGWASPLLGLDLVMLVAFCALLDAAAPIAFGAIAVCVLWANLSPAAFIAPLLALAATAGAVVDERGATPALRRLALVSVGSIFAMALTPGGVDYAADAFTQLGLFDKTIESFAAWDPSSRPLAQLGGFAPLLVLSAWIGLRHGGGLRAVLFSATAIVLGLASAPLMPLAAFAIAPILARAFARDPGPFADASARTRTIVASAAAAACALLLAVSAVRGRPSGENTTAQAVAQAQAAGAHRIFCAAPAWCNYAIAAGGASVVLDSRLHSYPEKTRTDAAQVLHVEGDWKRILDRWHVDAVVTGEDRSLSALLALDKHWRRLSPSDPAVYLRAS